jgi:hypothetical protein
MAEEEGFEDLEEPDDPDVVDLEALEEEDILDDEAIADDEELDEELAVEEEGEEAAAAETDSAVVTEEEDDEDEDDDVLDPDDVEAGLDVILKDRLVAIDEEDEEDEETPEVEERGDGSTKVLPKRPGEFVCESCFLLKHPSQLADPVRMLCRDCV